MKAVILAGGFGTRLSEYTETIPKPMVKIGSKPMIIHIMEHFAKYGVTEFIIAAGYKSEIIKKYFLDFHLLDSDLHVNTKTGDFTMSKDNPGRDWKVSIVDTGNDSMTGGRLLRVRTQIGTGSFFLTYGDGISDVNLKDLVNNHQAHKNLITVTAVRPSARFGELTIDNLRVTGFKEKPQLQDGWINGGFFVVEPGFLDLISGDSTILEKEPLETASSQGLMGAHLHEGFWQCVDTKRDRDYLQSLWDEGRAPWVN